MKAGRLMRLLRGDVLFRKGEPGKSCYWINSGTLKVSITSEIGEERILALLGPGAVVGELAILDNLPRSATLTAISDANLTELKSSALVGYLRQHPDVYADLVAILVKRLRETNDEVAADSFLAPQARIARAVLSLVDRIGKKAAADHYTLSYAVSQRDIGAMAGVTRESVSRTLSEWQRRGIITRAAGCRNLTVSKSKLQHEANPSH
jgi:CRP/FNR family cyclic AMP-dependent transcriptional regulator